MTSIKKSSFFVPSTTAYARAGLRSIGYEPRSTPYWPHSVLWALQTPYLTLPSTPGVCPSISRSGREGSSRTLKRQPNTITLLQKMIHVVALNPHLILMGT
ncbi:hypothetical protein QQ045_014536 [Rhodiola kirilowii]